MDTYLTHVLPLTVISQHTVYKPATNKETEPIRGARASLIVYANFGLLIASKEGSRSVGTFSPLDGTHDGPHNPCRDSFMLYAFTPLGVDIGAAEYLSSLEMRQTFYTSVRIRTTRTLIDGKPKLKLFYILDYNENNAAMTKEDYIKSIRHNSPLRDIPIPKDRDNTPSDKVLKAFYNI